MGHGLVDHFPSFQYPKIRVPQKDYPLRRFVYVRTAFSLKIEGRAQRRAMEPAMGRKSPGIVVDRKITGPITGIETHMLRHLVAHQGLKNAVHALVGHNPKAAAIPPEQEVKFRSEPEAQAQAQ
jgi:hypothetical protein